MFHCLSLSLSIASVSKISNVLKQSTSTLNSQPTTMQWPILGPLTGFNKWFQRQWFAINLCIIIKHNAIAYILNATRNSKTMATSTSATTIKWNLVSLPKIANESLLLVSISTVLVVTETKLNDMGLYMVIKCFKWNENVSTSRMGIGWMVIKDERWETRDEVLALHKFSVRCVYISTCRNWFKLML